MSGYKGTITVHGSRKIALECEEGDAATEELKFYKDHVDPADMTSLKKPTIEHEPVLNSNELMTPRWLTLCLATHPSSSSSVLTWIPNRKARSSSSSVRTGTSLHGNLQTCRVYRGNSLSTLLILIQSLSRSRNFFADLTKRGRRPLVRRWPGS